DSELPEFILKCGSIRPGNIVELRDHSRRASNHPISGDFLLVRSIVENVKSEEVVLRGFRMRRCTYLRPLFDGKLNDVFMLIEVRENDKRPRFVQGLEDVSPDEVIHKRECVFTNVDYDILDTCHVNRFVPARLRSQDEKLKWLFRHGKLICRWVHIVELHKNGKSYGGEARRMYKREVSDFSQQGDLSASVPPESSIPQGTSTAAISANSSLSIESRKRISSIEESDNLAFKRPKSMPSKPRVFTLGDGFCDSGGVSSGAQQAGFKVMWGLDKDKTAMKAYRKNFPGAQHLEMDAHVFPGIAKRCFHGCDHLHMSCPCNYWAECHTVNGKNDEANMLTIYTVEAWLGALKPRAFSLEQAPGLLKQEQHKLYFRNLINGVLSRGYGVRWKIQDQAWLTLPQHRRRLIFVGSKTGIPLPPFPAPIRGPPGSGLKRYTTIEDALKIVECQSFALRNNRYHQPQLEKRLDLEPIDPHVNLAKCVTTSGGDNVHHSGQRLYTVIELAQLQGFLLDHCFAGSLTQAKTQCGNAWPPRSNKHYFLLWAAHREAFDNGFIGPEDEVLDL
ncbi:S-adenosyl-L-methionine-dependent methyltransferase, partial [Setomelanomma holmii]